MDRLDSGLKFSIKGLWAPAYINGKLLAARIMPLHRIEEKLFQQIDDRGQVILQDYYYNKYGILCEKNDTSLTAAGFLKKNHVVSHAFLVTYNDTIIVLGYNLLHHRYLETNPESGIHVDYFSSAQVNYPGNIRLPYLGNFVGKDTCYMVRGIGSATIALACHYAAEMHPKQAAASIAVDLTARADTGLLKERYTQKYGFEPYAGARGNKNELYLTYKKARMFLKNYEKGYESLERPEANGVAYKRPHMH